MPDSNRVAGLIRELRQEGIDNPSVLGAMEQVPRELFVPTRYADQALRNVPLPIGEGQTISQPFVVALMTQALALAGTEKVLEVGTGSGYQAAILSLLSRKVISVERIPSLAATARARLAQLGYGNVEVLVGDGSLGHLPEAPYDAIIVTAASPQVPQPLLDQLTEEGRLILPMGSHYTQELVLYSKGSGQLTVRRLGPVKFVPLIGEAGWKEQEVELFLKEEWW